MTEHEIPGVAVAHSLAGGEVERLVAHGHDRLRDRRVFRLQRLVIRKVGEVRNPRRMRQQVEDRDRVPRRGRVGHVLFDRIVERQLAAFREQKNGGGGELLRDGAEAIFCRRRVGNVPFEVRRPVALGEDDLAAARDEHRAHEGLVAHVGLHDFLHARRVLCPARAGDEEQHDGPSKGFHAEELTVERGCRTGGPPAGSAEDDQPLRW